MQAPSVPGSWRTGHFHQQTWIPFSSSFSVNAPRVRIVFQKQNPRFTPLLSPTDNCHCNKSQASRVSEDMQCSGNAGGRSLECLSAVVRAASILEGLEEGWRTSDYGRLSPKQDLLPKGFGCLGRGVWKTKNQKSGQTGTEQCLLYTTGPMHSYTQSSCGCLHKTCRRSHLL